MDFHGQGFPGSEVYHFLDLAIGNVISVRNAELVRLAYAEQNDNDSQLHGSSSTEPVTYANILFQFIGSNSTSAHAQRQLLARRNCLRMDPFDWFDHTASHDNTTFAANWAAGAKLAPGRAVTVLITK